MQGKLSTTSMAFINWEMSCHVRLLESSFEVGESSSVARQINSTRYLITGTLNVAVFPSLVHLYQIFICYKYFVGSFYLCWYFCQRSDYLQLWQYATFITASSYQAYYLLLTTEETYCVFRGNLNVLWEQNTDRAYHSIQCPQSIADVVKCIK